MHSTRTNSQNQINILIHIVLNNFDCMLICLKIIRIQNQNLTSVKNIFHKFLRCLTRICVTDQKRRYIFFKKSLWHSFFKRIYSSWFNQYFLYFMVHFPVPARSGKVICIASHLFLSSCIYCHLPSFSTVMSADKKPILLQSVIIHDFPEKITVFPGNMMIFRCFIWKIE